MTATVGLVVNPAAGRDIRRLTGGASVSDNYAKRRTAGCALEGLALAPDPVGVVVMPDRGGLGRRLVDDASDGLAVDLLDISVEGSAADTRRAAAWFRSNADAVIVLGGDGTTRDVAAEIGDVPVVGISTGTNNVVPTPVDGTVAGAAAALVATGAVATEETTVRHGSVEARVVGEKGERSVRGLATVGVLDRPFVGTRAILDAADYLGGVVSRASPSEIGLSGVAGMLTRCGPDDPGGVGLWFGPPAETPRAVRAITVPGVVDRVGVAEWRRLAPDEPATFDVPSGVVSADGERELEVRDARVEIRPVESGPRLVDFDAVFERAAADGGFAAD
ncbi:NAD(+)/NADH kinase [Halegenticoccus tardaugens]|uniref:NAD(+)/NADH kinase n=1 Tax=Halegenticoccus tardaugens TaxID=2071624 RepID=UPI00100A8B67|nr:NAD(+)/NADH kinase [Halegenticoccus tardaugens]